MLPSDFASWELFYYYCRKCFLSGEFDILLKELFGGLTIIVGSAEIMN